MSDGWGQTTTARAGVAGEAWVPYVTLVGIVAAAAGIVVGFIIAFTRRVAPCPDGTVFPVDTTDFTCHAYPQGLLGTGLIAVSAALGVLILLVARLLARSPA